MQEWTYGRLDVLCTACGRRVSIKICLQLYSGQFDEVKRPGPLKLTSESMRLVEQTGVDPSGFVNPLLLKSLRIECSGRSRSQPLLELLHQLAESLLR